MLRKETQPVNRSSDARLGRANRCRRAGTIGALLIYLALPGAPAKSDIPEDAPTDVETEKARVLEDYWAEKEEFGDPWDGQVEEWPEPEEDDVKRDDSAQTINTIEFRGTGSFGLKLTVSQVVTKSYLGYIVDSPSDSYQDMVVLKKLKDLSTGEHRISAACSDYRKSFPPSGYRMSNRVWTSSSRSSWAYWVRRAAEKGVSGNYSFTKIQAAVWYITDRKGERNSLLRSIGYSADGPTKNASGSSSSGGSPLAPPTSACGVGLCGGGLVSGLAMTTLGLIGLRIRPRRPRSRL